MKYVPIGHNLKSKVEYSDRSERPTGVKANAAYVSSTNLQKFYAKINWTLPDQQQNHLVHKL